VRHHRQAAHIVQSLHKHICKSHLKVQSASAGTRKSTAPFTLSLRGVAGGLHRLTMVATFGKTPGFRPLVVTQ